MNTNQLLASKVVVTEEESSIIQINGTTSSDCAMLSITERGPMAGYTLCNSFTQYKAVFGNYTANGYGAVSAKAYFDMGGTNLWVSRTAHYTDPSTPSTITTATASGSIVSGAYPALPATIAAANSAPYTLTPGMTVIGSVTGGGALTATFTATAASVTSSNAATFDITTGQTLIVGINDETPITVTFLTAEFVSIAAATALEVCAVINAAFQAAGFPANASNSSGNIKLTTTTLGSGSSIDVTGGTARVTFGFSITTTSGTGNVANIAAVTATEVASVVSGALTGTTGTVLGEIPSIATTGTGSAVSLQFTGGTATSTIGFITTLVSGVTAGSQATLTVSGKTSGAYGNAVTVSVLAATNGLAGWFNLFVYQQGALIETWPNLNLEPTSLSYALTAVNAVNGGSNLIALTNLAIPVPFPYNVPGVGTYMMTGGSDGLSGLADSDFVGSQAGGTGLRAFDQNNAIRVLTVPGEATPAVHNAMCTYASAIRLGSMFAVLDPPMGMTTAEIDTYVSETASLVDSCPDAAIYWPNIYVSNPSTGVFGSSVSLLIPPSVVVAGRYAANDATTGGVYEAPAGIGGIGYGLLNVATGVETTQVQDEGQRDLLRPYEINPIVGIEGLPIHMDGCLTLGFNISPFPTIGERRGMIYIEQSLEIGLVPYKHRGITATTLRQINSSITVFMTTQTNNNAFSTTDPTKAFIVDTGSGINTAITANALEMLAGLSVSTKKPGEYILVNVSQNTTLLQQQIAAATSTNS